MKTIMLSIMCLVMIGFVTSSVSAQYTRVPNAAISGHNTKTINGSVKTCKKVCTANGWCKSFDYHKGKNKCDLSNKNRLTATLKRNYGGNPYDHYTKTLASTRKGLTSAYKVCATEGQHCSYTGTGRVAYGANGKFEYKNVSRGLACTDAAFGRDPVPGIRKKCYVRLDSRNGRITSRPRTNPTTRNPRTTSSKSNPLKGYRYCAQEGKRCNTGTKQLTSVMFGANGKYKYRSVRGGVDCTTRRFGDPAPGVRKKCYVFDRGGSKSRAGTSRARTNTSRGNTRNSGNTTRVVHAAPRGYSPCSTGGQRCNFTNIRTVAYGVSGRFVYKKNVRRGIDCNARAFGRDPAQGKPKRCYSSNRSSPIRRNTKPRESTKFAPPNSNYKICASEGTICRVSGRKTVAYGYRGTYKYKRNVTGSISCNSRTFGGDPAPGKRKVCWVSK